VAISVNLGDLEVDFWPIESNNCEIVHREINDNRGAPVSPSDTGLFFRNLVQPLNVE
jgi:hypothetical protein